MLSCAEFDSPYYGFLSLEERYNEGVRQEVELARKLKKLNITDPFDVQTFSRCDIRLSNCDQISVLYG